MFFSRSRARKRKEGYKNMGQMLFQMIRRNLKIFLKDKANIFFALLSPLIVLGLYVIFIGRMQTDGLLQALSEMGISGAEKEVRSFCDSWMLTGVMACACITVPLCACGVMIQDKMRGITADLLASPVPYWLPRAAYFCAVVAAGIVLSGIVLCICFIWLAFSGWALTVGEVFGCIGTMILSVLSSSGLLVLLTGFLKTEGAFTGVNIVFGTVVGFLIGAYMPIGSFPKGVQYVTLFFPGTYSAGLFRNLMMRGTADLLAEKTTAQFVEGLEKQFSMTFDFFGYEVHASAMAIVLAVTALVFIACNLVITFIRPRKKALLLNGK